MNQQPGNLSEADREASRHAFVGGAPCIDFVNTVDSWLDAKRADRIGCYDDLVDWIVEAGLLTASTAEKLRVQAASNPTGANRVLRKARALRAGLYRILVSQIQGRTPEPGDLKTVTALARRAASQSRLTRTGQRLVWVMFEDSSALGWPVWKIAASVVKFLTSEDVLHVRQCADETCGWLFIDHSRNHSRRWCDMRSCGNRAKARRKYARQKELRRAT